MAATSIMPSAPRFSTPAFSLMSRPRPASASGVPEASVAAISSASLVHAQASFSGQPASAERTRMR